MNMIERQTELGKSLYEININVVRSFVRVQRENIKKYIETSREFGSRIPELNGVRSAIELQYEYNATLWRNAMAALEAQNELVISTTSETREALMSVYSPVRTEVVEAPKPKAKPKLKARVKAKAKPKAKPRSKIQNAADPT